MNPHIELLDRELRRLCVHGFPAREPGTPEAAAILEAMDAIRDPAGNYADIAFVASVAFKHLVEELADKPLHADFERQLGGQPPRTTRQSKLKGMPE